MENKFYYKTPAVLLMMLAGSTAVAHAAEDQKPTQQTNDVTNNTTTNTLATQNTQVNNIPVTQTNKATDLKQSTATSESASLSTMHSESVSSATATSEAANSNVNHSLSTASTIESQAVKTSTVATEPNATVQTVQENATPLTINRKTVRTLQANTQPVRTVQKATQNMSINDYIKYNNFKVAPIVEDYSSHIPKYGYRNGVGNPEGIIAHETANNTSTIWGEVQYMKNNYQSAFVHAFVDDNNIIETAPTDYLAWGAGPVANERFIHVELVRVQGKDRFARAINNYADYIATNLQYYNLPVDSAEYDGNGTLWSHKAVSNFLGGTDHSDPYGWFQANGYSMDELVQLVTEKYNAKVNGTTTPIPTPAPTPTPGNTPVKTGTVKTTSTSKMAKINSNTAQVYSKVLDVKGSNAGTKANNTYFVNKQATLNNEVYYALTDQTGVGRGWVKAKDLTLATRSQETKLNTKYKIKSTVSGLFNTPWGTNYQKVNDLKKNINQTFNATKKLKVNNTTYYFGTVNQLSGWIQGKYLTSLVPQVTNIKPVKLIGRTAKTGVLIYTDLQKETKAQTKPVDTQFYITEEATKASNKFFKLQDVKNKVVGWINDKAINQTTHQTISWEKAPYIITNANDYVYSIPGGASKQRVKKLSTIPTKIVNVIRTDKVGSALWYKVLFEDRSVGYVSGKSVKKFVKKQPIITKQKAPITLSQAIDKQMQLVNKTTNSGPKYAYLNNSGKSVTRIATRDEVAKNINPKNLLSDAEQKYQFLKLNQSQGIAGNVLNQLLVGKGILENKGDAFAKASKLLNINEIYLISHAILETGHGTSKLSNGLGLNASENQIIENAKTKYYNMFGTKATDNNALLGGTRYAKAQGWNTPEKAIVGGGKYVLDNYFNNNQVTLYQMRWNPANTATHQYATDVEWANKNARLIANYYKTLGLEGLYYTATEFL